tara:strand:+ start:3453 stop:3620 length:168 start_codon:yes stop_codon:yes gene_type:complete
MLEMVIGAIVFFGVIHIVMRTLDRSCAKSSRAHWRQIYSDNGMKIPEKLKEKNNK